MAAMDGHEDLKMRQVVGFSSDGKAMVMDAKGDVKPYDMFVAANGSMRAREVIHDDTPDQVGGSTERIPVAERWRRSGVM